MATNLLILHPYDLLSSTVLAPGGTSVYTLFGGSRGDIYQSSSAATSIQFDLQFTTAIKPTVFAIARANLLTALDTGTITATLIGSASALFTSPDTTTYNFTSANLVGPHGEDIASSMAPASSFSFWRLKIQTTNSIKHEISKWYFGEALDLGRDPSYGRIVHTDVREISNREPATKIEFTWTGLTNAKVNEFMKKVGQYKDSMPVMLYASTYSDVLFDWIVFHATLKDYTVQMNLYDVNTLTATFEECI